MAVSWSGGDDDIESHYHDFRMSFPEAHEIPVIATHGTKWKYTVNERDRLFMSGIFALGGTPDDERVGLVLSRNYLENQTKVRPFLYSMQRATNDLSYYLLMGRLGFLKHHVPLSPLTMFKDGTERHFAAFMEVDENEIWLVDPILKAGMCPRRIWLTTIRDPANCWIDFDKIPGLEKP